jgi:hypothetical protein
MTSEYVPVKLRRRLLAESDGRCAYCRSSAIITGMPLEIEHIIPRAQGGKTTFGNLRLACHRCNEFKGDRTEASDPLTQEIVALFNPRAQLWHEHFAWSRDGLEIIGLTACGRATALTLRLNNEEILAARHIWVAVGLHPPDN